MAGSDVGSRAVTNQEQATPQPGPAPSSQSWGRGLLLAALILALSDVGFLLIPNRLVAFLATRVGPNVRDGIVTGWVMAFFLVLSWVFVRLQPRGKRA